MGGWGDPVRAHIWRDESGAPVLRHTKYLLPNGETRFPWEHRRFWAETGIERWFRGKGADEGIVPPLLYPLDLFVRAHRSEHVFITEGEKDADALIGVGVLAVTAGGVCEFSAKHARLFRRWRGRVTIVRDNDAPGASGAVRTYDLLRDVGIPAHRLRVALGRCRGEGADATDHLAAGWAVEDFFSEPIANVRRVAATATSDEFRRAGYDRAPRYAGDPGWSVVGRDEAAQLVGWKPRSLS